MLLAVQLKDPLFWAVFIGWIMSVVLHEFAHGVVAYWGGDYTIRERGGLTLNPLQYVDPMMSIVLPMVFMLMGGVPLPGGATYIRRDLLRSRAWSALVSAAGPAMNFLLFLFLGLLLHPRIGWVSPSQEVSEWTLGQKFVGALAFFELLSVLLNLVPVPPLDGFQIISPFLPEDLRIRLTSGPAGTLLMVGFFVLVWNHRVAMFTYSLMQAISTPLGIDFQSVAQAAHISMGGA